MKILDCTLRDGGYYTNWDFNKNVVETYCKAMENLPIDYIEIGYRSIPLDGYLGKYFYCPLDVIEWLKEMMPSKKLVVILNEKDIRPEHVEKLLIPCLEYISLVRIAIDPENFKRAILLAKSVKKLGFEVAFNVMYMSSWKENNDFLNDLDKIEGFVDFFYMVDSYGGILQKDVIELAKMIKLKTKVPLGFHGHNNLEMALANTITAIDNGCEIIDATITGMGRGAGNLKTELLLTYLNSHASLSFDYNTLTSTVTDFEKLKATYQWGTSLPYMFSGANSLPQKKVMEWVSLNRYSMETILNALRNQKNKAINNFTLPIYSTNQKNKEILIIGGGSTVLEHESAIRKFISQNNEIAIIFAGVRYIEIFEDIQSSKFIVLSGKESNKMNNAITLDEKTKFIYPPSPRVMGTAIPEKVIPFAYELESISFTQDHFDSPLTIAIELGLNLGGEKIYFVGYDGYDSDHRNSKHILASENKEVFNSLNKLKGLETKFLTLSNYSKKNVKSIYSYITV